MILTRTLIYTCLHLRVISVSRRFRIPRILLYLLIGLLLGNTSLLSISRDFLRALIDPLLVAVLFYGGFSIRDIRSVRRSSILTGFLMATLGALLTAIVLGIVVNVVFSVSFLTAFALGVILAPNDPVAVISATSQSSVGRETEVIVKVESGFDDTIVTTLTMMVLIPSFISGFFDPIASAISFGWLTISAIVIGAFSGYVITLAPEIPLRSFVLPLLAWFLSTLIGSSPYVASFVGGMALNWLSPQDYMESRRAWDAIFYAAEATTFITLGSLVKLGSVFENLAMILVLSLTIMLVRPLEVLLFTVKEELALRDRLAMTFMAMKGVDPVMLAIALLVYTGHDFLPVVLGVVASVTTVQLLILSISRAL